MSALFEMQANSTVFHQSTANSAVIRTFQGLDPQGQGQGEGQGEGLTSVVSTFCPACCRYCGNAFIGYLMRTHQR